MVASIWLQLGGNEREIVRNLIDALADEHGTLPFEPHLTVCTIEDPTAATGDAAADYIANCRALPLRVRKAKISCSTATPLRAVVLDVEDSPELRDFRETLRELTDANALVEPHISLLYAIDPREQHTSWAVDANKLQAIAAECEMRLTAAQLLLERPILVAPDGDWTKIKSWRTLRRF